MSLVNSLLAITYSFTLGYLPSHDTTQLTGYKKHYNGTEVQFELGADLLDHFLVYAGEQTYQTPDKSLFDWEPYQQTYYLGAEFHWEFEEKLNLKLGVKHSCTHPIDCWSKNNESRNEALTELYFGISGRIKL